MSDPLPEWMNWQDRITELEAALAERDAELTGQTLVIREQMRSIGLLQQALAERDATIAAVTEYIFRWGKWQSPELDAILSAAPGDTLTAHDAAVKAQALEEAAVEFQNFGVITGDNTPGYFYVHDVETEPHDWLRDGAKAIREEGKPHD